MDRFVGKRLDGRYEIREIIGVGGMAVVYKAYDCIEDRIVAVKILKEEFISNEEFIIRFKNESKAIAVLNHPNIVKVYDVSFGDLIQYIVMEYVDGITLKQYIEKQHSLRWKDAVYLTIQVLRALQHAHDKGIVHRDVKPQNIMLLADGTIKVTDFGIARFARSEHKTMTDKAIGSVHYISPEQARGEATDEKADIYSVGVMLYEMLTGQLPFEADSAVSVAIMQLQQDPVLPRDINENIPVGLEQVTMHAMQKDVFKRYRSAAEMLRDLEEFRRSPDMVFEYTYFVDNEPTRFVDAVNDADSFNAGLGTVAVADSARNANKNIDDYDDYDDEDDEDNEKSPVIPILTGVAIAFVIAMLIGIFLFFKFWNEDATSTVTVPKLVGMTIEEIRQDYPDYKYVIEYQESADIPAGTVMKQSPSEGREIKDTQKITLTVSQGTELVPIPRIANLSTTDAQLQLRLAGLQCELVSKHDATVPENQVISTNPPEGTPVKYGTKIQVYVSIGPEVKYVDNVDCVGYKEADAIAKLEAAGLTVKVTPYDVNKPAGIVVKQTPDKATSQTLPQGSTVEIFVSTGVLKYSHTVTIDDMPTNFAENSSATFIAWKGNEKVGELTVRKINEYDGTWTVNIDRVSEATVKLTIEIKFADNTKVDALVYIVDMINKTETVESTDELAPYLSVGGDTSSESSSTTSSEQSST
ncbi:MAG: Stk1 family PASTA domain-containing Ser/Thr kinase [Clostridia bacterium]|nr:Stk1 family PASTA domain-containing Ser/Thr kinase [Clostridia bacterium]